MLLLNPAKSLPQANHNINPDVPPPLCSKQNRLKNQRCYLHFSEAYILFIDQLICCDEKATANVKANVIVSLVKKISHNVIDT